MSGGVDSSVSALELKNKGYEVIGATMELWGDNNNSKDAKEVCATLGLEHVSIDYKDKFNSCVIKNFISEYSICHTPNPCIECNKHLKFKAMWEKAQELGCDYIATGHYAKIEYSDKYKRYVLKKATNLNKDQSYVLYSIPLNVLPHVLFPLGNFNSKDEIRKIAKDNNLSVASKSDSHDKAVNQYYQDKRDLLKEKKESILDNLDNNKGIIATIKNKFYKLRSLPISARISYIEGLQQKEGKLNGFKHLNKDIANKLYPRVQKVKNNTRQIIEQLKQMSGYLKSASQSQQFNPEMEELINNLVPDQPTLEEVSSMHR